LPRPPELQRELKKQQAAPQSPKVLRWFEIHFFSFFLLL
jgi:hypothetical protein